MTEHKKLQPEIRFAGFTDDWEQRKLRDVIEKFEYGLNAQALPFDGLHKYIRITDIDDESRTFLLDNLTTPDVNFKRSQKYKLIKNDIVFARTGASVGKTYLYNQNDGELYFAGFLIRGNILQGFNAHFIFQITLNEQFKHFIQTTSQRSGQPGINAKEYSSFEFLCPSLEEQTQIGNFFKQLDDTIALHQGTLEKYQKLKVSYLEKMFPKENKRYPELRFPNFTDAWEQRKLGEFGISTSGTSLESEFLDSGKYKVISIGSYSENSIYTDQGIRVNKTNKTESKILRKNDLTMILNDKTASGNIIGRVLLIDADESYVYNQRTQRIETDQNKFVPEFLYQLLNANNIRKKIILAAQGNTQIYVNWSSVRNISYLVPKSKEEQTQIGNFFKQLDDTIALHQRELEKFKILKTSYLENIFLGKVSLFTAKNTITWEQRKLGELGYCQSGIGFPELEQGGKTGIPFYKVSDMNLLGNEIFMENSNNYVSINQITNKKWKTITSTPAVIFAKVGAALMLDRKRLVLNEFLIDNNTMAYIFDDSWHYYFGKTLFDKTYLPQLSQTGALPSFNAKDVEELNVILPTSKEEQTQIGNFFKQLDDTIALHQKELAKYQQIKAACLEKMFVE